MALRRPRPSPPGPEVRARLAERYRRLIDQHRVSIAAGPFSCPWPRQVEALESGRPVECYGWELRRVLDEGDPKPHPSDRVRVEPDGSVVTVRRYGL